ncbi:MAG TPA: glycosyltransferase [Hyphomicrobium sp.]|nr:glycosyltransferase [Hyphomicrobium sp.]
MTIDAPRGDSRRLVVVGPSVRALSRLRGRFIGACVERGIQVLALAPEASASGSESLSRLGAKTGAISQGSEGFTLFRARKAARAFAEQLRQFHPHAVLAFGAHVGPIAVAAARRAGVGRIALLVNDLPEAGISKRLTRALKAANIVIVHNDADACAIKKNSEDAAEIVRVAGAGADLTRPGGIAMPKPGEPVVFLAAARLDRIKGIHDYLEAARIAHERGLDARFVLAGPDGSDTAAIKPETLARYAPHVRYVGDEPNLADLIAQCHVFVCPSHREGLPGAVLAALAAGRVVIATDIPGARETVDEMVNGTLCEPGDPAALAEAFIRIARNGALLGAMSRASRAKAERNYSEIAVHETLLGALHLV